MNKIAIRADGGNNIGMGHIMRCMAISKELLERNIEVIFISKFCEEVNFIFTNQDIKFVNICSNNLDDEILEIEKVIKNNNIDCLITDSYNLSDDYLFKMKKIVRLLISIDDNSLYNYPSDIIINGNIYAKDLDYSNIKSKLLLGTDYCILRDDFKNDSDYYIRENVEKILITMGGSDINNFTDYILQSIKDISLRIDVVIGPGFRNISDLEAKYRKYLNINFIHNPSNMKGLMLKTDIAISASGSTIYELSSIGVPTIVISQAENQLMASNKVAEYDMMIDLGYYINVRKEDIKKSVNYLISNYDKRLSMNINCKKNIVKNGVKNIVDEIMNFKE